MRGIAVQLIGSSLALVVMAGAVGFHWWKLELEDRVSREAGWHVISAPSTDEPGMFAVSTGNASGMVGNLPVEGRVAHRMGRGNDVESVTVLALQEVVAALQAIKDENKDLRAQLMETNREMNGLQIQLDGYDDDFKPLKLAPTAEGVIDSGNPLLPPKRW